jgi:hypothetical protein
MDGKCVNEWFVDSYNNKKKYGKIILDNERIFYMSNDDLSIKIYSNNGKYIKSINVSSSNKFDIYGNYIYTMSNQLIECFTKEGKKIFSTKHKYKYIEDLIVIGEKLYVITCDKVHVHKIKFF